MTSDTAFLGVIALATTVMAVIQLGAAIYAARAAREATRAMQDLRREVAPILENARRASEDATRITALTLAQVERVDTFIQTTTARVDETLSTVQEAVEGSAQQGTALLAGVRAALAFFSSRQERRQRADEAEDDDSLFIG